MNPYLVVLYEEPECVEPVWFDCEADDSVHAAEQARDAYPGCEILDVRGLAIFIETHEARKEAMDAAEVTA